jgi:hypothetical protein
MRSIILLQRVRGGADFFGVVEAVRGINYLDISNFNRFMKRACKRFFGNMRLTAC